MAGFAVVDCRSPQIFVRYARYVSVLKWLTVSLFAYRADVVVVARALGECGDDLLVPHVVSAGGYLTVVVAVFGTTISPYLFFWQAGQEVEDEKEDPAPGR